MKRILLFALCALLSADAAARTLYVDATRPNNNGSGLSAKQAKKTIQAAINASAAGDTILVLPGTYAPIKTDNRKIVVKGVKGAAKTEIVKPKKASTTTWEGLALAQLGAVTKTKNTIVSGGGSYTVTVSSAPVTTGRKTTLAGFLLNGKNRDNEGVVGLSGGTAKSCRIENIGSETTTTFNSARVAVNSALSACKIQKNALMYNPVFSNCTVSRCVVSGNSGLSASFAEGSVLSNTLVADNSIHSDSAPGFDSCELHNCTIAGNLFRAYKPSALPFSRKSRHFNCILWDNWYRYDAIFQHDDSRCNAVTDAKFKNAYRNCRAAKSGPGFVHTAGGNYKLAKGSVCIDKGSLSAAQKKIVGAKDLAGGKRVKGKAVDIGCYEY